MRVVAKKGRDASGRGSACGADGGRFPCDCAIVLETEDDAGEGTRQGNNSRASNARRDLLPGGLLCLIISLEVGKGRGIVPTPTVNDSVRKRLENYSEAVWDVDSASTIGHPSSSDFLVILLRKRSCVVNAWSCPWMDKRQKVPRHVSAKGARDRLFSTDDEDETFLQYERRAANEVTISPSVAERTRERIGDKDGDGDGDDSSSARFATALTRANVERATSILREHGLVVIRGLLPPSQTIPWGEAVLSDFETARTRLRRHPTRPVDLMNPHASAVDASGGARRLRAVELGGTAFVHGSHKLSVTAELLSEDDADIADRSGTSDRAALRRQLLQLRTLRPALEAGDVVFFDCRTIHYGLANTSRGDLTGKDTNAGRRPMLYLNVSQAWFHDPKNWDDREKIFD